MKTWATISLYLVYCTVAKSQFDFGIKGLGSCGCPKQLREVCGDDQQTYLNDCHARCHGVNVACSGYCPCPKRPEPCACKALLDPVCGDDGETYDNADCAACAGAEVVCRGGCPCDKLAACSCIAIDDPVCGTNNKRYGNACLAECEGVKAACKGDCPCSKQCVCTKEYRPVCSTANQVYGNKCMAMCDASEIACEGTCPCPKKCNGPVARCSKDPCDGATCAAFPDATCRPNYCGGCNTDFIVDGEYVDCDAPTGCVCPEIYSPVCSTESVTYDNKCFAECEGAEIACEGTCPCKKDCLAPLIKCGKNPCDGAKCRAYPDAKCVPDYCKGCESYDFKIDGKIVDCASEPSPCVCTLEYNPVCGVNGKTYGNQCGANCAKVEVACAGECPCKKECDGAHCFADPCQVTKCPAHPNAECRSNFCNCSAEFYVDGQRVKCKHGPSCGGQGAVCDYKLGPSLDSAGDGCCPGLRCCLCSLSSKGSKGFFSRPILRGRCLEKCTHCK